jgi:amino acid transporter
MAESIDETAGAPHFVRGMGLFSATAIVMGSMIGSGIFIVSADMSRTLGSPALLIAAWLVTAAMTIIGALSYGELAAMMPKAGGQYVYLREALGPLWGFLYGWTLFLVIQTGTIAAVGVAFGKYCAGRDRMRCGRIRRSGIRCCLRCISLWRRGFLVYSCDTNLSTLGRA